MQREVGRFDLRLQLFGELQWILTDRSAPIVGRRRADILLTLVEHHGRALSADYLLDRVWSIPPASGRNAVQRHISALRRQLGELVDDPSTIIESVAGGYRLNAQMSTDVSLLASGEGGGVAWWEKPLAGRDPNHHIALRSRLESLATSTFEAWANDPTSSSEQQRERMRYMIAHSPHNVHPGSAIGRLRRELQRSSAEHLNDAGCRALRSCIDLWSAGRSVDALDALEIDSALPSDFRRRLCRWLIWFEPADAWARYCLSLLVRESVIDPINFERSVVTIDARCFALMENGRSLAAVEVAEMNTLHLRARSLRVLFMLGLSAPYSSSQHDIIDQLEECELTDAFVEAARFRFHESVRAGYYQQAKDDLANYEAAVNEHWRGLGDDFSAMAASSLRRSVDPDLVEMFGSPMPRLGAFSDEKLLPVANTVRNLLLRDPSEPLSDAELAEGASGMAPEAVEAMYLLRDMNTGRPVQASAESLAEALPKIARTRQFHLVPVALTIVAEALQHRRIAAAARRSIEPWSGQILGIWPIDFVFGPADDWIKRLDAIG